MSTQVGAQPLIKVLKRTVGDHAKEWQGKGGEGGESGYRGGYRGVAGVGVALIDRHCPADAD